MGGVDKDKSRGVKSEAKKAGKKTVRGGSQVDGARSFGGSTGLTRPPRPKRGGSETSSARKAESPPTGRAKATKSVRGNSTSKSRDAKAPSKGAKKNTR